MVERKETFVFGHDSRLFTSNQLKNRLQCVVLAGGRMSAERGEGVGYEACRGCKQA